METVFIYYYLNGFIRGRGILATVARLNMLRDLSHLRSSYIMSKVFTMHGCQDLTKPC